MCASESSAAQPIDMHSRLGLSQVALPRNEKRAVTESSAADYRRQSSGRLAGPLLHVVLVEVCRRAFEAEPARSQLFGGMGLTGCCDGGQDDA